MKALGINWFIEGSIDFEHKKYVLLAYLQHINRHFRSSQLYPDLGDLVFHYNNLLHFKNNKVLMQQNFPQRLTKADFDALKLTYEKMVKDDYVMQEIERIITFSLEKMNPALQQGKEIYDFVETRLLIDPVGVLPLIADFGYLFIRNGDERGLHVYEYNITFRGISTTYIANYSLSFVHTPESIKIDLISSRKQLPNPAVYQVACDINFPLEQTLLPVAKRSLVKYISKAA
jgi:hypothetical protein